MVRGPERLPGESFEDWKKRCFGIETLADFKARVASYETDEGGVERAQNKSGDEASLGLRAREG